MLKIRIELKTDTCASSGMSVGNCLDNDLCCDSFGLPVIPGRRLKGVVKQAAELLRDAGKLTDADIVALFGNGFDDQGGVSFGNAELENAAGIKAAITAKGAEGGFSPASVTKLYTYTKGQTSMDDGVAADSSLRYTRVLSAFDPVSGAPLVFYSTVTTDSAELWEKLSLCCKAVRHMGLMRNRGLGWVKLSAEGGFRETEKSVDAAETGSGELVISYTVALDSGVVLPGCSEQLTAVPGRTMIGCMASAYIKKTGCPDPMQDGLFRDLFLNGTVKWSDLTPMVGGKRSVPAPLMLGRLKHEERFVNCFNEAAPGSMKRVDGMFAAETEDGKALVSVSERVEAHFRRATGNEDKLLYSVASIPSELLYGGTVTLPESCEKVVTSLLRDASLRLGGSRNAQYAACRVTSVDKRRSSAEFTEVKAGEPLYVLLLSDMLLLDGGIAVLENGEIRSALAAALSGDDPGAVSAERGGCRDYAAYHTVGGYNAKWRLQKRQQTVISGGSVFCLTAAKELRLPAEMTIGENLQEGFGRVRILSKDDMAALNGFEKRPVDKYSSAGEPDEAFIAAVERMTEKEKIPERALRSYQKLKNKLGRLVNGRVRLMTEQAKDLNDLRRRLESIKSTTGAKEAALALYDGLFTNDSDDYWREFMLAVLHLHYYDKTGVQGE